MTKKVIKILAIVDQADNLVVLKTLIKDSFPDAVFIMADSGRKGFELCEAEIPDVILLDIVMPGMDGYEVCKKLKDDFRLKNIPVIMVTAHRIDKNSRVKALEAGADAFIQTPVDLSELKAQIKAMLRIKEAEDLKKAEKQHLEDLVLDRTEALEIELADRIKAENRLLQSLDKITKNRQAILNLMEDLKIEIAERKIAEENIRNRNSELSFLNSLATDLSCFSTEDDLPAILNRKLKEFTGSDFLVYSEYDTEHKNFITRNIEADQKYLNKLIQASGDRIMGNPAPINITEESLNEMVKEIVTVKKSLSEISFGAIPVFVDKVFSGFTGMDRYIGLSYVVAGEIYGTSLIGIKKNKNSPSTELLKSFAHIVAVSLQRRRAEVTLKKSEEDFRTLIQNQGEGVGVIDLNENFTFVNPAAEEMFGVEQGELLNRNLLDFIDPDQISIIKQETKKRSKAAKSSYEIGIIRPDGARRTCLVTATPQLTNEGKLLGTFGVFRDITDRKIMEQKIIESETYYRTLIDISPDGIIVVNPEGNITYASQKAYEIFAVPFGVNVIGLSIKEGLAPENQQSILQNVINNLKNNVNPGIREIQLQKYDGALFWGELSSSPLSDLNGNPLAVMIVCRDISDRKRADSELIKSKEKAEESDRLKTAFLHNISHEIRTPMNAIVGFSALLGEPDLDSQSRRDYIELIMQSSNHLLSILSDIIDISNIEAGIVKIASNKIDVNNTLITIFNQFTPKAKEKNVNLVLETELPLSDSLIIADSTKLTQIISNLVSNSLKFTDKGSVAIGCELRDKFLEFRVSDTGIGISEEHHTKIFDRFYQVQHSISRLYEGTGLGLAISKANAEHMGGRMWLTSEPGKGTTFCFTIPYEKQIAETLSVKEKKDTGEFMFSGKKRILVAEDIDSNFKLISYFLSGVNVEILRAENGEEAVEKCLSNKDIDLILMDVKMPVMDGYTAVKLIRETNTSIPIIAQTAYADDKQMAIDMGCSGFISKPFDKKSLLKKICEFI